MASSTASPSSGPPGAFWERMAARYPQPFDRKSLADSRRVFELVESRGVLFDGAEILDIGCGTGVHCLPLAWRAARVVGLDSSEAMLACLDRERSARAIGNASTLHVCWADADIAALSLEGSFDIVWASMTPAVRSGRDLVKMRRCARRWCVYIGWGGVRRNELMEEAFRRHGCVFGPPPGTESVRAALAEQGVTVPMDIIKSHWDWEGTDEEARGDVASFLDGAGCPAVPEVVADVVSRYSINGLVRHRTFAEMGVLVWQED